MIDRIIICETAAGKGPTCTCSRAGNCSYGHECSCDFCSSYWRAIFKSVDERQA